ncbi:MAG: LAGLIDADG family homing endonuclease [archaeon]|nr:LAGLIDADG family homing endonuclease [archaeon]
MEIELNLNIKPTFKQELVYNALNNPEIDSIFFGGGAGGGKAQPLDSFILTRNGFVRMGDIKIGDKVLTSKNTEAIVKQIHPQGIKNIYEVEFIDGAKIRVTDEHLFDCWIGQRGQKRRKVRSLKEIIKLKGNIIIPLSNALEFGTNYNEVDCYTVGVLLGDGGLTKNYITLTTADSEIFDYLNFQNSEIKSYKNYQYSIIGGKFNKKLRRKIRFSEQLKKLGILPIKCEDRFVPKIIKNGSLKNRLEILRGLMDTDGYIDNRGHCSFTSKSKQLAIDVQFIVRSLGGKATLKQIKKHCFYKGIKKEGIYYTVYINIKNCSELFKLKRKQIRVKKFNGGVSELGRRITSIKLIGQEKAQCISIDSKDGLYVSDDFVVTHNSWLICESRLINAIRFPGYRSFIGRKELKRLMQSTFITFQKVCQFHKIPQSLWKLNGQYNYIDFSNGSRIDFLDVDLQPADPLFERFGSLEYTDGALEEAGEIHYLAYDVLKSRIGRHKNKEFKLKANILITGNPKKNWTYTEFYKPWKKGLLSPSLAFIQALYKDNPWTKDDYGKQLFQIKDKATKERLMFGNWEYDEDPNTLMDYDSIVDLFTNNVLKDNEKYLVCDVARFGKDKTTISIWQGLRAVELFEYVKQGTDQTIEKIKLFSKDKQIPYSHILVDEDGVGGGVVDGLRGIKGFINNSSPIENPLTGKKENYSNLKTQCTYVLTDKVINHNIRIDCNNIDIRERIIEELGQIKAKNADKDSKLQIIPKEEVKEMIGRSPDWSDNLLMRMWFELKFKRFERNIKVEEVEWEAGEFV